MSLSWIADTDQGPMVGDYISTSFTADGKAHAAFAIAKPPTDSVFSERAASATFDPTAPQVAPRIRTSKEPTFSRGRRVEPIRTFAVPTRRKPREGLTSRPWGSEG